LNHPFHVDYRYATIQTTTKSLKSFCIYKPTGALEVASHMCNFITYIARISGRVIFVTITLLRVVPITSKYAS
jgi:hypothetical protein